MSGTQSPRTLTCKAAVAWGPGEPLIIEQVQVAPPQPLEVRIKVVSTSLCRSDITFWEAQGHIPIFPRIFGHEATGIVESVGEGVTDLHEGDRVLTIFTGECKECRHCKSTKSNMCEILGMERKGVMHSDQRTRFSINGKPVYHFCAVSSFSEYTVVHSGCTVKLNSDTPLGKISILSCGVATGFGAAWKVANVEYLKIIFCLQLVVKELTSGGADYSFECVGNVGMIRTALESCCDGWGMAVVVGVPSGKMELSAHYGSLLSGRTLKGTLLGGWKPRSELPMLVEMYLKKVKTVEGISELQVPPGTQPGDVLVLSRLGVPKLNKPSLRGDHLFTLKVTIPTRIRIVVPRHRQRQMEQIPSKQRRFHQNTEIQEIQIDEYVTHELSFSEINKAFQLMIEGKCLRCVIHIGS